MTSRSDDCPTLEPSGAAARLERAVAETVGARWAVAVDRPATGVDLACRALGLGAGDLLWAAPNGGGAAAAVARECGARIDLLDVDPITGNLSTRALTEKLDHAERHGRLPKVLVAYHEAGQPCDMAGLNHLGNLYGFHLIEEASLALGARYGETRVGDCRYGDIVVLGTAGGGAVLTTNREDWAATLRRLGEDRAMPGQVAVLGERALEVLEAVLARREALAARYEAALAAVVTPWRNPDHRSALPFYPVRLPPGAIAVAGVGQRLPAPIHLQPEHQGLGFGAGDFPEAERFVAETLCLPLEEGLTDEEQDRVIARVRPEMA